MEPFNDFAICLREDDHVAVVKRPLKPGTLLERDQVILRISSFIPAGHKIALKPIEAGQPVNKYGQIIGFASTPIHPGDHVHVQNLEAREFQRNYAFGTDCKPLPLHPLEQMRYFQGYPRPGGRAGTRNYLAVISTVNCSAAVSKYVAERFRTPEFGRDFPEVDGVIAFTHKSGCGMPMGESHRILQRVLAGIARHPNISGYLLLGLGCEVNQAHLLAREHQLAETRPGEFSPLCMTIQQCGGISKTVEAGVQGLLKLLPQARQLQRVSLPASKLVLAENCGGSDAASGITANPALGVASDELVRFGGASVLAETTEIYGAEHLLTRRAVSSEVGEKLVSLIRWWEDHVRRFDCAIDNNPSYGNKEGGLTTIYEKSLGAVAKAGQAPLSAVYQYAEPVTSPGLCFMDTPGFDPVSMTGLVAGGCNIGVFTTGRGSVYGCKPAPCIKVASNTALYEWMKDDMDLNAGTIMEGAETVQQVGSRIFEKIIAVAGGEKTKSELAGMGDDEFAPWPLGPTL